MLLLADLVVLVRSIDENRQVDFELAEGSGGLLIIPGYRSDKRDFLEAYRSVTLGYNGLASRGELLGRGDC